MQAFLWGPFHPCPSPVHYSWETRTRAPFARLAPPGALRSPWVLGVAGTVLSSCWCARLRCAPSLALAYSRPRLLSRGASGIKAAADTGLRAEGPVVAAQGALCEERTGGAQGRAFGVDLQEGSGV